MIGAIARSSFKVARKGVADGVAAPVAVAGAVVNATRGAMTGLWLTGRTPDDAAAYQGVEGVFMGNTILADMASGAAIGLALGHPVVGLVAGFIEGGLNVLVSGGNRPSCDGRPRAFAQHFLPRMPKDGNLIQNVGAGLVAGWKTGLHYDFAWARGLINGDLPHTSDKNYDPAGPCFTDPE